MPEKYNPQRLATVLYSHYRTIASWPQLRSCIRRNCGNSNTLSFTMIIDLTPPENSGLVGIEKV